MKNRNIEKISVFGLIATMVLFASCARDEAVVAPSYEKKPNEVLPSLEPQLLKPAPVEGTNDTSAPLSDLATLEFTYLYSGQNEELPDFSKTPEKVLRTDGELKVHLHSKLLLPSVEAIKAEKAVDYPFLVWNDEVSGEKIQSARYTHCVKFLDGRRLGDLKQRAVHYDGQAKRYFLPMKRQFERIQQYSLSSVDADHDQILNIDLMLESGRALSFELVFHAVSAVPELKLETPFTFPVSDPKDFASYASKNGRRVHHGIFRNPTDRKLKLWLRSQPELEKLQFDTQIRQVDFIQPNGKDPVERRQLYISSADFEVRKLTIQRTTKKSEVQEVELNGWVEVEVLPNEAVKLTWFATPKAGVQSHYLPAPESRTLNWTTKENRKRTEMKWLGFGLTPVEIVEQVNVPHSRPCNCDYSIHAARIIGKFKPEIRLAHAFLKEEEVTGDVNNHDPIKSGFHIREDDVSIDSVSGPFENGAPQYSLQGVFP